MPEKIPEIEKRRAARRRRSRRRHMLTAFAVLLCIAVIVFAVLSVTVLFPVKNITASGSAMYTEEELVSASGILDNNFFLTNTKSAEENLRKELPYVDSVKLDKKFPDTVKITVKDAKEYLCYKVDLSYYIVSEKGYVLKKVTNPREELIEVVTSGVTCKVSEQVVYADDYAKENTEKLLELLKEKKISVNKIDTTLRYEIKATVEGKFDVNFGSSADLKEKCGHLAGMLESIDEPYGGTIDLSTWSKTNRQGTFKKKSAE